MASQDARARGSDARPPDAPPETSTDRPPLLDRLRDANEQLLIRSMRTQRSLGERLRFEQLLTSLSAAFNHSAEADVDRTDQPGLRQVVDFLGVDRGRVIEFSRDGGIVRSWAIEEWMDGGEFPWMAARLRRGEVVDFSQLEELPDEAAVDRQSYLTQQVKPQVAVPLRAGGTVVGGLVISRGAAERSHGDEVIEELHLLGEVFAQALSRKQGVLEAQRLRQELMQIGRISVLGEFAASLAHELAQPLTAILSNTQTGLHLLAADTVNLEEIREILKDIETDDKRAGDLIYRLRGLIKQGDPEFVGLDVNDVVAEVGRLVKNDAALRDVSLRFELAADLPKVRGDRVQLQQVVLNLVLNGFDAMPASWPGDRTLVLRTTRDGTTGVAIAVQDSGIGIDDGSLDRIFDPLYTTKADGLGMGLAITRTIVSAHGGRVRAANNVQGGATFQFTLPAAGTDDAR